MMKGAALRDAVQGPGIADSEKALWRRALARDSEAKDGSATAAYRTVPDRIRASTRGGLDAERRRNSFAIEKRCRDQRFGTTAQPGAPLLTKRDEA